MGGGSMLAEISSTVKPSNGASSAAAQGTNRTHSRNFRNSILGPVPSRIEVERAIAVLQRFIHGISTSSPELDGLRRLLTQNHLNMPGFLKLRDAFYTLLKQPSLRNTVVSVSSDRAVWEAILNNKEIQDLQLSITTGKDLSRSHSSAAKEKLLNCNDEADILKFLLNWIMEFAKSKILELVGKFVLLVDEIFNLLPKEKRQTTSEIPDHLDDKIRSSVLLSVVILLVVVANRIVGQN